MPYLSNLLYIHTEQSFATYLNLMELLSKLCRTTSNYQSYLGLSLEYYVFHVFSITPGMKIGENEKMTVR